MCVYAVTDQDTVHIVQPLIPGGLTRWFLPLPESLWDLHHLNTVHCHAMPLWGQHSLWVPCPPGTARGMISCFPQADPVPRCMVRRDRSQAWASRCVGPHVSWWLLPLTAQLGASPLPRPTSQGCGRKLSGWNSMRRYSFMECFPAPVSSSFLSPLCTRPEALISPSTGSRVALGSQGWRQGLRQHLNFNIHGV